LYLALVIHKSILPIEILINEISYAVPSEQKFHIVINNCKIR